MAGFKSYIFLIVGFMVLFNISGLVMSNTTVIGVLKLVSTEGFASLKNFSFWDYFSANIGLVLGIAGGLIIGTFGKADPVVSLSAAIASGLLGSFIGDLISVANTINASGGFVGYLAFVLFSPFLILYIISMWDWIRGIS